MVNVNLEVEAADYTTVVVSEGDLLTNKFPHSTFPMPVEVSLLGIVGGKAKAIAEVLFPELARETKERLPAMRASRFDFMDTARRRSKPLPPSVALVITAGAAGVLFGVSGFKRFSAYGATERNVTALVIAVVFAAMLVEIQVSALLARELVAWNYLPTTTSAVDNFGAGIFGFSGHLLSPFATVILRYYTAILVLTQL